LLFGWDQSQSLFTKLPEIRELGYSMLHLQHLSTLALEL
jgi:hypothetical protein